MRRRLRMSSPRLCAQLGLVAAAVVLFASVIVLLQGRQGFTPRMVRPTPMASSAPVHAPVVMHASPAHGKRPSSPAPPETSHNATGPDLRHFGMMACHARGHF